MGIPLSLDRPAAITFKPHRSSKKDKKDKKDSSSSNGSSTSGKKGAKPNRTISQPSNFRHTMHMGVEDTMIMGKDEAERFKAQLASLSLDLLASPSLADGHGLDGRSADVALLQQPNATAAAAAVMIDEGFESDSAHESGDDEQMRDRCDTTSTDLTRSTTTNSPMK